MGEWAALVPQEVIYTAFVDVDGRLSGILFHAPLLLVCHTRVVHGLPDQMKHGMAVRPLRSPRTQHMVPHSY